MRSGYSGTDDRDGERSPPRGTIPGPGRVLEASKVPSGDAIRRRSDPERFQPELFISSPEISWGARVARMNAILSPDRRLAVRRGETSPFPPEAESHGGASSQVV